MDKAPRKILRSPSVKRKSKVLPVGQRLTLERVLGLTVSSNAAFSCDPVNGTIAYPAGCVVVLFNPRRNRQSHIFNVSKKTITSVAFSGDGKHLVTGECGHQPAVRVWDVEEKTQVAEFHGHKFGVNCVAFSPNLKYIVSIGSQHDMMVNVWNWRTGNKVASNKVSCKVNAVSFGADSASFVTVGNRHVKFWYLDSSKSKINQTVPLSGRSGILGEQKNNFFCDVVCGQGQLSGSTYIITQSGLLCEFNEKRLLDKWVELRTKSANCITAGEEHIFIGCAEGIVRVFSADTLSFIATLPHPHHLGVEVATATSSSDMICTQTDAKYPDVIAITVDDDHKKVACIYNDHSLYVWDVLNVRRVGKAWSFLFHSGCVWGLEVYPQLENNHVGVLPPGSFLTASSDDTIRVWNLDPQMTETPGYKRNIYSNELLKVVYTDPTHAFLCDVNYNPAGATDKTDTTWDGKNGVRSIRVSPDGEHLASGDRQGNVRIYDVRQMAEIRSIEAHESDVVCLEYSFAKTGPRILASGSRDRLIHVFDVEQDYGLLQTLDDHSAAIQSVRFTDANNKLRMLSCGSDKSLLFRNAALNPEFEFSLSQHLVSKATMYDMIIDPTQKFVATACQDRNIRVYNMATAKQKKNYRGSIGDEGTLLRVQLDPSGTYAATSCTDKNICVLEFYTGELTASAFGHSEISTGLRFTNDLKHLISVSADGCIFVWRLSSDMTKNMRSRMEELGKMPKDETIMSDLRKEAVLMPNPVSLDGTFVTSSSDFPLMKENISPARVLSSMDPPSSRLSVPSSFPTTPVNKRTEAPPVAQPSAADCRFSVGPLPNWAKAKFDDVKDGVDGSSDSIQPKGRWAQRFDQNLAFKSQLDLSQLDDDGDQRRLTALEAGGLQGGDLATSMPDLRRETVVLSQHAPAKNIPIIDDDETNIDDEEDFFPAYMKNKLLPGATAESDRSSSDHEDRRRMRQSDPLGRRSAGADTRRWSSRISLGNEDKGNSNNIDFDDTDELDTWSDTTEVIYPPSEPESVDTYESTYQVFAADGGRKMAKRTSNINLDEDSESTDHVSIEDQDDDDANEEMGVTSSSSTPSDPDREFMPRTPDKEQFLKENFESVSFTPVAMDKFAQQVATLERAAEVSDPASMPFSPRLSLSSRFLSRSQFGAVRAGGGLGGGQRPDNWFDPLRKTKSDMARAMDETRKRLTDMNWRSGGLLQESPEKEDPPSPPTKLDNKEPSFSTPKLPTSAGLAGKLERDNSPIAASPTRTMPASPIHGPSTLAAREKRRSGNGVRGSDANGSSTSTAPPPRQVPSYFRTTKSSRLKSSSSSSLLKQAEVQNNKTTSSGLYNNNNKSEAPVKKRMNKGRISSSRLAMYASTPNLANFHEDKEETVEEPKLEVEAASNLRSLADLSLSVPDINCLDDPASTDSSSSSGPAQKDKEKTGSALQGSKPSPSRRSLPPGHLGGGQLRLSLASHGQDLSESQLMPPPSGTVQPVRTTQSGLLRRAVQVRKRSTSELTLEQAKSILLGNSGILGAQQASPEEDSPTSNQPPIQHLTESTSSVSTQQKLSSSSSMTRNPVSSRTSSSTSTLNLVSSRNNSSSSRNNSSSHVFDTTEPSGYTSANTLAVAEEIDRTANQLRRERERAAAAALDASRFDPPERDQPSPRKQQAAQMSAVNSTIHVTFGDSPADRDSSVTGDEDSKNLSVQERIALLNQQSPKRGSPESVRLSLEDGQSHSASHPSVKNGRTSGSSPFPPERPTSVYSPSPTEQRVSPRSQSDTGLGSDTDTDSDMRYHHHGQHSGAAAAVRGDRSRLSLRLAESSSPQPAASSSASEEDYLRTCMSVVSDLKLAVQRAKDFHSQINKGNSGGSANHQQMTTMLSEAFRDAHLTLAHLALQSPVVAEEGDAVKPLSCPLVEELGAGAWDSSVMDKARDMLQPFMSHLSRELSEELVKMIRDRLEGGDSP